MRIYAKKVNRDGNQTVKHRDISHTTIQSYLDILQDVFLVEKSVRYDIKGRKYIDTPVKYYFSDLGLRNARLNFRQYEETHLMENLIYNELRLRGMSVDVGVVVKNEKDANGVSIRKQYEVDFVCNQGSQRYYIQSAFHLPSKEKREQEVRSLKDIKDSFKKFVITGDLISRYQDDVTIVSGNYPLAYRRSQLSVFTSKVIGFLNIFPYSTGGSTIPSSGVLVVFRYIMPRKAPCPNDAH